MRDIIIIFIVLLVLLIIISAMGGSIRYDYERFQDPATGPMSPEEEQKVTPDVEGYAEDEETTMPIADMKAGEAFNEGMPTAGGHAGPMPKDEGEMVEGFTGEAFAAASCTSCGCA